MTSTRLRTFVVAWATLCVLETTGTPGSPADSYQVIVNPDNNVTSVDRGFLREAFLKRTTSWDNGDTIRPVDLTSRFPAREAFAHEVLNKTLSQVRSYWNQQIFSGKGVPPPELDSEAAVIRYVLSNRGGIGYLPANANPDGAKVLRVR